MENKKSLVSKLKDKAGGIALSTFTLNAIYAASRGYSDSTNPQPPPILESAILAGVNAASTGFAASSKKETSTEKIRNWAIGGAVGSEVSFWVIYSITYWSNYLISRI